MSQDKQEIRTSARALQDLMAGKISLSQYRHFTGLGSDDGLVADCLRGGLILEKIVIESGGIDQDDDELVLTFATDPAASDYR